MIQHFYIITTASNLILFHNTPEKLLIHRLNKLDRGAELRPPILFFALQSISVEAIHVLDSRQQ